MTVARHPQVVLFDGVCNLCNFAVRFIAARDPHCRFVYAPVDSPVGRRLLAQHGLQGIGADSFVLIAGQHYFLRAEAALMIAAQLDSPWRHLANLQVLPETLLNAAYNLVARHRYSFFGRRESCAVPAPDLHERFLNDDASVVTGSEAAATGAEASGTCARNTPW